MEKLPKEDKGFLSTLPRVQHLFSNTCNGRVTQIHWKHQSRVQNQKWNQNPKRNQSKSGIKAKVESKSKVELTKAESKSKIESSSKAESKSKSISKSKSKTKSGSMKESKSKFKLYSKLAQKCKNVKLILFEKYQKLINWINWRCKLEIPRHPKHILSVDVVF